ncbi:acetyltransferase [Sphingorhabdus sp. YGSMI21]|nr:acetyltransferase [Sphingorhabdus sp. YGSMI21]
MRPREQDGQQAHEDNWVSRNRAAQKWTRKELVGRALWGLVQPAFRFSPRPLWGWRRWLLRRFGAQIGADVHVFPTVRVAIPWKLILRDSCAIGDHTILYSLGPITVGERATVSQHAHLCAGSHDWRDPTMPLLKPPITIGADVWVCANAFIGPGVAIGNDAIIGACAVVMKDVPTHSIMVGNPARQIKRSDI